MNAQQLKNSILQRAIEGKLVEQREEEGTAAELLREIKAEKARLVKEGKLKKEKPLRSITAEEIPFEIPESWEWVRLGDLLEVIGGVSYKKNEVKTEGIRVLRGGNIDSLCISFFDDDVFLSMDAIDSTKMLQMNDIIIVSSTGSKKVIGKPGFVKQTMPNTTIGAFLRICRLFNTSFVSYIQAIFASKYYRKHIRDSVQGTNINNMKQEHITNFLIPLPPLAEQKRIVAKIEELLPHVEQYGKAHDELTALNEKFPDAMKKSVLQYAMEGKLVEQREEEGTAKELLQIIDKYNTKLSPCKSELNFSSMNYDIPASWSFVELNRILSFVDYRGKTPHKSATGIFLITASNIKKGYMDYTRKEYISREEYQTRQERGITEKGDLLFTTEAPMGSSAICDIDECSCGQRIITFKEYHKNTVDLSLMMYFILSPRFQQQLLDNCTGTTAKGIKAEKLKHFLVPLPPLAEQKRIVAKIEELLACCGALEK